MWVIGVLIMVMDDLLMMLCWEVVMVNDVGVMVMIVTALTAVTEAMLYYSGSIEFI